MGGSLVGKLSGYFDQIFGSSFHIRATSLLKGVYSQIAAALHYLNILFSDWNILPYDRIVWHE